MYEKIKKAVLGFMQKKSSKNTPNIQANIVRLAENQLLTGKTVLITGGTSGIGFAMADAMLSANADRVIITGRTAERCEEAVSQLTEKDCTRKDKIDFVVWDICECGTFELCFKEVIYKLGNLKLSVLVNNAGVQGARFGKTTEEEYDRVMDTNYKGVFFLYSLVDQYCFYYLLSIL